MILIIYAPPRYGKTVLMSHFANMVCFDRSRTRSMQNEILLKRSNGFENLKTIPNHCVAANYDLSMRKFGYSHRFNRKINPFRLGFQNQFVDTHFSLPYEFYCIDEAQKYFDSHMAMYYPRWQSEFMEQHGHNYLDFLLATQRPMLINANIRDLAQFLEVVHLDVKTDDFGKPCKLSWVLRHIENSSAWESYMSGGKKDKGCYKEVELVADYNVFDCYDSRSCKPKFYAGHMNNDFDYEQSELAGEDIESYIKY